MKRNPLRRSPRQVPINSAEFLRTFVFDRAPLSTDFRNFKVSDLWIHRDPGGIPEYGYHVLVDKPGQSGIWIDLGGVQEGDIQSVTGDEGIPVIPDASGNIDVIGGSRVSTTGTLNTLTINLDDDIVQTVTADAGILVVPDASGNINIIGGNSVSTNGTLNTLTINTDDNVIPWTEITGTSKSMDINNGYVANNAALVTFTLPAAAVLGDFIQIDGKGVGGWLIAQNASQVVHFLSQDTTTGVAGSIASTNRYSNVTCRCIADNLEWTVEGVTGNLVVI